MSDLTEKDLIKEINSKKTSSNASFKGFGKTTQSKTFDNATIKVTDSLEAPEESKPVVLSVETSGISEEAIKNLINSTIEPLKADLESTRGELKNSQEALEVIKSEKEATEKALQESKEAAEKLAKELVDSQKNSKTLEDLSKLMGKSLSDSAQPLTVLGDGSQEMRNYQKLLDTADTKMVSASVGYVQQKDLRSATQYWKKNKQAIGEGVEAVLRNSGFLQGGNRILNAPTLVTDIPSVALTHLSNYIRENTYDDLVHNQFFTRGVAPGTPPNLNTAMPNYPYAARPTTVASRQLTPGTAIFNDSDPVTERLALITIEELGLGKDTNSRPIGLTNFVQAFSMVDLENIIQRNLAYDYQAYLDLRAYSLWFAASTILYPGQTGNLITNSASLVANDGLITRKFFINLNAFMKANRFATFQGGYYGYMHTPGSWAQYTAELSTQERFVSENDSRLVSKMLQIENDGYGGVVQGFKGLHDGFMHFMTNSYGVGTPGSTGVTNVTVATVPTAFESNFAFGSDSIAEATALPVEIRKNEVTDYRRRDAYIWYSHQGFTDLNVNVDNTTGKERRVVQVRNRRLT
jgi:hypothetical protein